MNTADNGRSESKTPWPVLYSLIGLSLIVTAFGVRAWLTLDMELIQHDDAISLMAATGHQGEYAEQADSLAGRWLTIDQFRRYVSIEDAPAFATIRDDLISEDIHPPFYFWVLHLWMLLLPLLKTAGPFLNIVILTATSVVLFHAAKLLQQSTPAAVAVVAVFAASPMAIDISLITRQYELWMLWSVSILYLGMQFVMQPDGPSRPQVVAFALVLLLGMLTHYYFAFSALAVYLGCLLYHRSIGRDTLKWMLIAAAVSASVFFLTLPDIMEQLRQQQDQSHDFSVSEIPSRLITVVRALFQFAGWRPGWPVWPIVVITYAAVAYGVLAWIRHRRNADTGPKQLTPERLFWIGLGVSFLAIVLLYALQFSPKQGMGSRYLAGIAPLLALAVGLLVRRATRLHTVALLALAGLLLGNILSYNLRTDSSESAIAHVSGAQRLVVDNIARGILFPLVVEASDDAQVFAAWRIDLIRNPEAWIDELRDGDVLLVSNEYKNKPLEPNFLLGLVAQKYEIRQLNSILWLVTGDREPGQPDDTS